MQQRKTCRKFYKELRDNMSQEQVLAKSEVICKQVLESAEYRAAKTVLAYYPLGNEVNCLPVIEQALAEGKQVALPRTGKDCQMDFYEIHSLDDVEEGNFHVMEPKTNCAELKPESSYAKEAGNEQRSTSTLVLVPGVVFDSVGNRYGFGKGFYDRYFARFSELTRMALAFTEQISEDALECLETDVKMHMIVTDKGILT